MTTASTGTPRELGFWMCTALVIGNTIGIGIFMMPAALAPYGLNSIIGWLITVLGCVAVAWVFAGLARIFPQDDGPYAYTQRAFGSPTAFMVLWCYWVSIWVTNATIATSVVGYLAALFPVIGSNALLPPVTALSLIWIFVLINLLGVRTVGWMQILTMILKLVPMGAVIALGLWQFFTDPSAYTRHVPATPIELGSIASASTIALFAMLGIECATIPAGRVRNPERTIPRATIVGTLLTAFIYISVFVVPLLLIPQDELAKSNAPFADLLARFIGSGYGQLLRDFRGHQRTRRPEWLDAHGRRADTDLCAPRHVAPRPREGECACGADARTAAHRCRRQLRAADELHRVDGQRLRISQRDRHRGATFPFTCSAHSRSSPSGCAARSGAPDGSEIVLVLAAAVATAFSIWLFKGVGIKSLLWARRSRFGGRAGLLVDAPQSHGGRCARWSVNSLSGDLAPGHKSGPVLRSGAVLVLLALAACANPPRSSETPLPPPG